MANVPHFYLNSSPTRDALTARYEGEGYLLSGRRDAEKSRVKHGRKPVACTPQVICRLRGPPACQRRLARATPPLECEQEDGDCPAAPSAVPPTSYFAAPPSQFRTSVRSCPLLTCIAWNNASLRRIGVRRRSTCSQHLSLKGRFVFVCHAVVLGNDILLISPLLTLVSVRVAIGSNDQAARIDQAADRRHEIVCCR
eukprot:scpid8397/ scgid17855/ 